MRSFDTIGIVTSTMGEPQAAALADLLGARGAKTTVVTPDSMSALAACQLVVDASVDAPGRAEVLTALGVVVATDAVVAVVTGGAAVTPVALAVVHPERVVGLRHTRLGGRAAGAVEVTRTVLTDAAVLADVEELVAGAQGASVAVTVADRPGALLPSLLLPYLNDAARMHESRYASREDIDAAMRLGCGHPTGPLALLDELGLDVAVAGLSALHAQTDDHRHAPVSLLSQLVSAGRTGVAAGRGFYSYDQLGKVVADEFTPAGSEAGTGARQVRTIGVIGTGTMASGIVEVCARSGYRVTVRARSTDKVAGVRAAVQRSLDRSVSRGKLEGPDRDDALARITGTTDLADLADCDLVIEAVVEDLGVKQALFAELDRVCKPGAVLTTTTSSLPVVEIGRVTARPADVIGMHWFNPAAVMALVEVVPTVQTTGDVTATVLEVCRRAGKHPVLCGDRPGFIVNALLFPLLNDAVRAVEAGVATMDEVDEVVTAALGMQLGPFALIDVVGVDVTLAIQETLYAASREPGHAPAPSLRYLVAAGALGRKTRRGMRAH